MAETIPDWAKPEPPSEEPAPDWARADVSRETSVEKPTALGAAARGAVRGVLPAAGSMAGFGAGAEVGAALGTLGGPLAPFTVPAGAIIGGLGGAYAGGWGAGKAQEAVLEHVPEWARSAIGQSAAQRHADIEAHPYAAEAGELAPNLLAMSPRAAERVVEEGAGAVQRVMAHPATARVAGAGIMGGQEAASEAVEGEPIDPGKVAIAAGAGALMQRQTRLGERLTEVGAAPVRAVTGRGAAAPPASTVTPEGLPPVGEAVGFTWDKDEPPSRVVPKEYVDDGRGVRVLTEDGSESLIATADLMKGLTAPPLPERPQLEGEPATLTDIDKNAPPLEDLEASSTTGAQARAAGQTPERFAELQREAQANAVLLPETINPLLDAADRQERYGDAALKSGNTKDAETFFSVAAMFRQRAQEAGGGPPRSEPLTPEDVAAAAQARQTAAQPEILGQRTPGRVEPELSPEQQAEQEMAAKLARETPTGPTETSILGQRTPLGPRSEPITPEDELRAAQMRSSTGLAAEAKRAEDLLTRKAQPQIAEPARGIQPAEGASLEKPPETRPVPTEAPAEPPQLGELFPAAPQPTPAAPLTETVPKQPQRLLSWLRMNGGVQDPGGDVGQIVGGYKGRPGLINRTGMTLDDAALKAWEDGYFPTDQRPSVDDLLTAIDEDHRGTQRRYSGIDSEAAADYEGALARNSEVDRLANEYDIDPTGMSRTQFLDTVADRLSQDDRIREIAEMTQAHERAFAEAEARTKEWFASRGDAWEPDTFYKGVPRTLEDLERDAAREGDQRWESYAAQQSGQGAGGTERPGPPGGIEGAIQEGARPGRGGAGPEPSVEPAQARPPVTERTEQGEQIVLPGTERSSEQAAALRAAEARTAQERELAERNRTKLRTGKPQEEPGGIFAPPPPPELFAPRGWDVAQTEPEMLPGFGEKLDLFDHYQEFRNGYPDTPAGAHQSARDYVVAMGNETGFEHYAAVDGATGRPISAGTSGRPNTVTFDIPDEFPIDDPATLVVVHHNHPGFGSNLSAPDVSALQYRGIKWVVAHTQDGHTFAARLTPEARAAADADEVSDLGHGLRQAYLAAESVSRPSLMMQMLANKITDADANRFQADLIMRSLDAAGIVDSISTRGDMPLSETVRDSIIKRATPKAADSAAYYFDLPRLSADATADRINRSSVGLQPDITLARLSEGPGGLPAGAGAAEAGRGGVGEAGPGEEAVVGGGTELRLAAAGEPFSAERTEPRPEGRDYVDALTEEIGRETGGRGPGTYARDTLKRGAPQGEGRTPYQFKAWNWDITMPQSLAGMDWRSAQKWNAEKALSDDHSARVHAFRDMLPTYLGLSAEDRATLNKAAELYRLQGIEPVFDGRTLVAENAGQRAALTRPGERVYLDKPNLIQAAKEVHDSLQKAWTDLIEGTARKFGWQGDPTSEAIRAGASESGVAAYPKKRWERLAQLVAGLESQRQAGYMAPFMRFGDYYVAVRPKNPGVDGWDGTGFPPVSAFHLVDAHTPWEKVRGKTEPEGTTPSAVQPKIAELRQQYPEADYAIEEGYLFRKPNAFRDLGIPAVEKLMMLVGNDVRAQIRAQMKTSGDPEAVRGVEQKTQEFYNGLVETVLKSMYDEMQAGFKKRANATPGYDADFPKALGSYLNWNASHVADLTHRDAIDRADDLLATHPSENVKKYWTAWDQRNATPYTALDAGLARARTYTFRWLLGMNAASTAKIALHGPMLGVPTLTTGLGPLGRLKAAGSYFGALADIGKTFRADAENGITVDPIKAARTPEERAMLQRLEAIGVLHPAGADELAAIRQSGEDALTPQAKFNRRVLEMWTSNIRAADRSIRGAMALAAFRAASDPATKASMVRTWSRNETFRALGSDPNPMDIARFMIDRATGVWGQQGRAPIAQTKFGASVLQFRSYEMTYLSNLLNMATRMGPEGKVTAALMLGSMGTLAGAFGLPFAQDAVSGAEAIYKLIDGVAPDLTTTLTRAVEALHLDSTATEAVLHGIGRSALGIDLGSGVGFGEVLTGHNDPMNLIGPFASLAVGAPHRAVERMNTGQTTAEIAAEMLPNAFKNVLRGTYIYPDQGMRAATGTQTLTPQEISGTGRAVTSLGFQTAEAARRRELLEMDYKGAEQDKAAKALFDKRIAVLMSRSTLAKNQGNTAESAALDQQIRDEVAEHHGISKEAVRRGILQHTAPETAAARRIPKAARPGLTENPYVPAAPAP